MKKITKLLLVLLLLVAAVPTLKAQSSDECTIKYNLFKGDFKAKNYDAAYENWIYCMDNCPALTVNIYKYGVDLAEERLKSASEGDKQSAIKLVNRVYEQRTQYFPKDLAKVYSDWANFKLSNGGTDQEVFELLEKAFKIDPTRMGVKSIYIYFQGVTDRNKDTNTQKVFDAYDDVVDAVEKKMDGYSHNLEKYSQREASGAVLSTKDQKKKHAYEVNLNALGQVQGGLDNIIGSIATCERLIPLYNKNFNENSNNGVWLKRAVSRLHNKECTDDPLYDRLVEAYVAADPSPQASVFYAGILLKKGNNAKAMEYFKQAVDQESDAYKKADYLYKIAQIVKKRGSKSEARSYANKALQYRPSMGKAYLLIANLYATSANSCGTDEFSKRMVYVAALNKARQAKSVDPGISSLAQRYIDNYSSHIPDKKMIFVGGHKSGASHSIGCWIGETVRIP